MKIELISSANINVFHKGKVIGTLQSVSVDIGETAFWMPVPKVSLKFKINNDITDDIDTKSAIRKITEKLKKYKFVELV